MVETNDELLCNSDATVIHGGTYNLSDGDTTDTVLEHYKDCFIDNTDGFLNDGSLNTILYKDNLHLIVQGGKILRETICETLKEKLSQSMHYSNTSEQEQNFQNGRTLGWRNDRNNSSNNNRYKNNRVMMALNGSLCPIALGSRWLY